MVDLKQVREEVSDRLGRAAKELSTGASSATRELRNTAEVGVRKRAPGRRRGPSAVSVMGGAISGAIVAYFLDPQRGPARRARFVDWSHAQIRRGKDSLDRLSALGSTTVAALPQRVVKLRSGGRSVDDLTLRDRVENDVFRHPDLPKGRINVDVESGIVTIRGQVDNAFQIASVEKAVLKVPGVHGVENLLHVDGTPAPNKAESRESAS